ncbi:hypothetical protein NDN08_001916 [Rhodosorus marinus]|uniref:Glycolipid transfer protein domain-containing protein n=1 Tax=Rhodosorus marinus TaxID=101924 RepID=A0AAV8UTM7_9RHOD|nr:hypothetical protein NDN08_001916 [Rhodosorus marinus]
MLSAFEVITFEKDAENSLPDSEPFTGAMENVGMLFEHLGTGFGFIKNDIETKTAIVRESTKQDPVANKSLQDVVERELAEKKARVKKPPSISRTVLRLMFLYILMGKIGEAVQPGSKMTLRDCVSHAYDTALKPNHGFLIQKAAGAAMLLLPDIDTFLTKLKVDKSKRDEYLKRIEDHLGPLVRRMYGYYAEHEIMDLP